MGSDSIDPLLLEAPEKLRLILFSGGGNGADTLGYGVKAEGSFIAFCALFDTTALALAGGLRFILQGT